MRRQGFSVRPLGGLPGCLAMIAISLFLSIVLTIVVNLNR